jgi:hypothetical protein
MTYREVLSATKENKFSKWPERGPDSRLEPFAQPSFEAGIKLAHGAKVMTMGSCFARNIEEYFAGQGFVVPVMTYSAPLNEFTQGGRIQGILNKYTLASIAQEIEWVAAIRRAGGKVTWDAIAPMMLELDNGQAIDLQLSSDVAVSRERAIERRQHIYDIHVQFFDCDLAVLTPGLTETWLDTRTNLYMQRMPKPKEVAAEPDRYVFEVMDFFKCFEMLEKTVGILRENGTGQIAITVSPVPLSRTMTNQDVLVANTYSKSTLRSAVGLIAERNSFVKYVPSYEKVMLSKSAAVWRDDLRHVMDDFVGQIASQFAASTGAAVNPVSDDVTLFTTAAAAGRMDEARAVLERMGAKAVDVGVIGFHKHAARLLIKAKRWAEALPHAKQMQALRANAPLGYKMEFRIQTKLGDKQSATLAAERAVARCRGLTMDDFLNG